MKNFWLTPFLSSFIERRGTAPIVGVNLRWRIFFVLYFGALRPQTPGSTFPTVELEKSREKSPLKKFFSHTFRLLIYGEQPHPPTPSPNREGEKVPLCEERDLGWGYFNAIWQMKNFWLTLFFVLLHLKEGTACGGGFVYSNLTNEKIWLLPFLLNYYLLSLSSICLITQKYGRNYRKIKINIEKI